ncbi:hypothetical protein HDV00_008849 [Rhizophlyctis rosea]|nr:hypothetical protein HDV00_008849 [Rhizophlyctis rosea]
MVFLDLNGLLMESRQVLPEEVDLPEHAGYTFSYPVPTGFVWLNYLRPGLAEFLNFMFSHFTVGVWTSAEVPTVNEIVPRIFGAHKPVVTFSRNMCEVSEVEGDHSSKKKLARFWGMVKPVQPNYGKVYGQYNTIICDDDSLKVSLNPRNAVIVPPYRKTNSSDIELYRLKSYFEKMYHKNPYNSNNWIYLYSFNAHVAWLSSQPSAHRDTRPTNNSNQAPSQTPDTNANRPPLQVNPTDSLNSAGLSEGTAQDAAATPPSTSVAPPAYDGPKSDPVATREKPHKSSRGGKQG